MTESAPKPKINSGEHGSERRPSLHGIFDAARRGVSHGDHRNGRLPVLSPYVEREIGPGVAVKTESELETYVRKTAVTAHHPCGTCRMGPAGDDGAVVDSELRVHGIAGLRVVDASVFPDLVGGNINAPVIMVAEKASDLILSTH